MKPAIPDRPGRGLRVVLLLGFGGLLAMLLAAGGEALSTLQKLHAAEQTARQSFLTRNRYLLEFRSTLDVYGNRIDEYFLSYDPDVQTSAANDFVALARRLQSGLRTYPLRRQPEEQDLLDAIGKTLAEQEASLNTALSEDHRGDPEQMNRMLYKEVMPRNRRLIAAIEKVELWNQRELDAAGVRMLQAFSQFQSHLTRLLLIVLSSGLLLSLGSIFYIIREDREARRRYAELTESRDALSRLPSSLLDAQEEERRSISRELHDEVGQSLGALLVDAGRLKAAISPDNAVAHEQLARIKATAESTVNAVRNIALLLRPSMLDDLGLIAAIEWQAREISRRSEMEVEVEAPAGTGISEDLAEDYRICIYRITQEALNNAARHSGGHRAWVKLEQTADRIAVIVRDDGHGFDSSKTRGMGLLGMEERVRRLGGKLEVGSKPGEGTVLNAELPLQRRS
jgi:signal transduction histidine kinase